MKAFHLVLSTLMAMTPMRSPAAAASGKFCVYKTSAGTEQTLEIHFPEGHDPSKNRVPGLLLFHGGGWIGGNPDQFRKACIYFSQRGLIAATASYRMLTKEEMVPRQTLYKRPCITDASAAIRWFKGHASELGLDPERIITGGGSAGGHIAMMATLNRSLDDPADSGKQDVSVLGYLLFNPAFTLPNAERDPEVNAFSHLKPGMPPALFLFGARDAWKPASDALVPALRKTSAKVNLLVAENEGHGFWRKPGWHELCLFECDRFLAALGILKGPPAIQVSDGPRFTLRDEDLPGPDKP